MGAQWKHAGRQENATKRGKVITKLVKDIIVAAKSGDPDPNMNAKLRTAVEAARKQSVPRDTIERAIKRGSGQLDPVNYETVTYEGFGPHKVPVIVECLTDNRNRTASDVRSLFRKGTLGNSGSVAFLFNHVGLVVGTHTNAAIDPEEAAIEAGAQEFEKTDDGVQFTCDLGDLVAVTKSLRDQGWQITSSEFAWVAKDPVNLTGDAHKEVVEFLEAIDDNDDVHRLFAALK